jgi:hypothetical protein
MQTTLAELKAEYDKTLDNLSTLRYNGRITESEYMDMYFEAYEGIKDKLFDLMVSET